MDGKFRDTYAIIGCDANAPLATEANEHTGMVGCEKVNDQGLAFESMLHCATPTCTVTRVCPEQMAQQMAQDEPNIPHL